MTQDIDTLSKFLMTLDAEGITIENRGNAAQDVIQYLEIKRGCKIDYHTRMSDIVDNKFTRYPFGLYRVSFGDKPVMYFIVSPLQDIVRFAFVDKKIELETDNLNWDTEKESFVDFFNRETIERIFNS